MQANSVLQTKSQFLDKETWHKHFTTCKSGKCSKADYCNQHNLVYHQFIYWCRKFEAESSLPVHKNYTQFIPIKIKPNASLSKILCTLEFNDGKRLLIHEMSVIETIMGRP